MTRTRDDFVKECPAFGLDAEGKPGIDESSKSCQYCFTTDGPMHDACKAECDGAGEIAEEPADVVETVETPEPEAPKAKAGKRLKKEKEPKEKKPPKEKKAKKEKTPKADRKPSVMHILVDIVREGGRSNGELIAELHTRTGCASASAGSHVAMAVRFGLIAGFVRRGEDGKLSLLKAAE